MIPFVLLLHVAIGTALIALGERPGRRAFAGAAIAPAVTLAWLATRIGPILDGRPVIAEAAWVPELGLALGFRLDPVGAAMMLLVSGIGLLVCVYAIGYFAPRGPGTARLAGLLTLFAGAMLGVVSADHLLTLFVFWELTSVTSYLLIGNDDTDPRARDAALHALLVTGVGGLALLAGLILLGQTAGTYRLSELGEMGLDGGVVTAAALLILVGAFTKSAQLPFAGWLPGAMVAPTPISTYLHAATMVKAGVYLVARLAPVLAEVALWRPLILVAASATMLSGGWRALRQHDLKLLLAHGTVSQLGFLMLLFGMGIYDLAQAGIVLLLAHGAFKAALFMVVGIIDHQAGTRDITKLARWGPGWRTVGVVAVVGAGSMAGLPPAVGFIAKEKALDAALDTGLAGGWILVTVIVVGSMLTVAYSARFVLGVAGRFGPDTQAVGPVGADPSAGSAPPPTRFFVAPAVVLTAVTLALGLAPVTIDQLVVTATTTLYPASSPSPVVLWAGVNTALGLSALVIATGAVLALLRRRVSDIQRRFHRLVAPLPDADRAFWAVVTGMSTTARAVTSVVQNGSLPIYLMVILAVSVVAPTIPAIGALDTLPPFTTRWAHVPIAVVIVVAAVGTAVVSRRIAGALMLGVVGFAMSVLYVVEGAPDLALTQFAIETLATVLFVLVLRFLPRHIVESPAVVTGPIRLTVSIAAGVAVFVLALAAAGARDDVSAAPVSDEMLERSVPDGEGANVVNVILVDFRGLDTLGEITVLVVAGLGVVALARADRRRSSPPGPAPFERLPVVELSSRLLFGSILVLAVYYLFAGHNQPGGGFVAGLTAGAAISLRYVAGGLAAVRRSVPARPWTVLGTGLLLGVSTATVPILLGGGALEHAVFERQFPILGTVKTTSALPFDTGVFLVVVGLVLMAYEAFGDESEHREEAAT
ncbi:MAG: hydrogen gas-evolving membrane-bound hydrogenase subunit E [Acidimicrobiales bacterium]